MELIQQLMQAKSWEERYRLIIRAGNNLPQPNDTELSAMQPMRGVKLKFGLKLKVAVRKTREKTTALFAFRLTAKRVLSMGYYGFYCMKSTVKPLLNYNNLI